jgi:hypothetical protein
MFHAWHIVSLKMARESFTRQIKFNFYICGPFANLWNHLMTPSWNFVEVRWRSLFRSTSLVKRCTSYNAPPTSWKRAADRWSLRNFLPRSSLFMDRKSQKPHGARSGLYSGCFNGVPPIRFLKTNADFISELAPCDFWAFTTVKREFQGKKFRSDQRFAARFQDVGGAL